jgi:exodeoxyribonuclease VII large subunit
VTPDARELAQAVDEIRERMGRQARRRIELSRMGLQRLEHRLAMAAPSRRLADRRESLSLLRRRLPRAILARLRWSSNELEGLDSRLAALSPQATLERGYSIVLRRPDGLAVTSTSDVASGQGLDVRVADGTFGAVVEGQSALFPEE